MDFVPADCARLDFLAISPVLLPEEAVFFFRARGVVFCRIVPLE